MYKILANTIFLGKDVQFMTECHSTNELAMEKIKRKEASEGSVFITDAQTKGKGQRGSQWWSYPGENLTFSIVLRPVFLRPSQQFLLSKMVCLAIWELLSVYDRQIKIKWPNDIVHPEAGKLCGVLIENIINQKSVEYSVIGIGLNVNQTDFPFPKASSLKNLTHIHFDLEEIFGDLISKIEKWYLMLRKGDNQKLDEHYLSHLFGLGKFALYDDGEVFEGKIVNISPEGKLIIETQEGVLKNFGLKEVSFL